MRHVLYRTTTLLSHLGPDNDESVLIYERTDESLSGLFIFIIKIPLLTKNLFIF